MESEKASPLPEGRADGREAELRSTIRGVLHDALRLPMAVRDAVTDELTTTLLPLFAAPAVPVGVQPEPAEEVLHNHGGHSVRAMGCPACDAYYSAPAVPVVHPEPGDRLREVARILNRRLRAWLPADLSVVERSGLFLQAAEDLAPVVAAAVAAVRADLARQVEALRSPMPGRPGKLQDRVIGEHVAIAEAAALIRGRS